MSLQESITEEEEENYDHLSYDCNVNETPDNPCEDLERWYIAFRSEFDETV